jgi:hypothetical protein
LLDAFADTIRVRRGRQIARELGCAETKPHAFPIEKEIAWRPGSSRLNSGLASRIRLRQEAQASFR